MNSLIFTFQKNHSQPHSFLSKKYINQKTGDIIINNHIYIHLTNKTKVKAIISIQYTIINITSNNTLIQTSNIVPIFDKFIAEVSFKLSKPYVYNEIIQKIFSVLFASHNINVESLVGLLQLKNSDISAFFVQSLKFNVQFVFTS